MEEQEQHIVYTGISYIIWDEVKIPNQVNFFQAVHVSTGKLPKIFREDVKTKKGGADMEKVLVLLVAFFFLLPTFEYGEYY